jgi:uncharacterized cupredoxin-like copper-binding protein
MSLHHACITRRHLILSTLSTSLLATVLAGCSGLAATGPTVTATANDFNFKFSTVKAAAGKVHFVLNNQSKTYQHELWVYPQNQPKLQDMLAAKDAGKDVNEEDYLQGIAGKIEDLDPGKTANFDATLQTGIYEMACFVVTNIGGKNMVHYEMGMHGLLTVE